MPNTTTERKLDLHVWFDPQPLLALYDGRNDCEIGRSLNVARTTVGKWRRGKARINWIAADKIAIYLGLHPSDIWGDAWWEERCAS